MQKSKIKIIIAWLPVIFWCGLIFYLSSFHKIQASPVGWQDFIIRKTAHFSEYAILFLHFYRAFKNTTKFYFKKIIWLSFCLTVLYALSDELHQTFVSGRSGRFFDIGIDTLGALFGLIIVKNYLHQFDKTSDV
jgi:VanZ family protein